MEVFLEVTVQHKKYHAGFMERMRQQPEVTSCYQVEGEYDFLVKADVTSEKELEKVPGTNTGFHPRYKNN